MVDSPERVLVPQGKIKRIAPIAPPETRPTPEPTFSTAIDVEAWKKSQEQQPGESTYLWRLRTKKNRGKVLLSHVEHPPRKKVPEY